MGEADKRPVTLEKLFVFNPAQTDAGETKMGMITQ
jgi:hypothetical protein